MDQKRHIQEYLAAGLFLLLLAVAGGLCLHGFLAPSEPYRGFLPATKTSLLEKAPVTQIGRQAASLPVGEADDTFSTPFSALEALSASAEEKINAALDHSHLFIQIYGGLHRLTGRRVLEDVDGRYTVYKLSDGSLTFINQEPDPGIAGQAVALAEFSRLMAEQGREVLYLQAPQKIGGAGSPTLPSGVADYGNYWADRLVALLEGWGVDTLDFRDTLEEDGQLWTSYFFSTDHHWTPGAAFLCWQALAAELEEQYGLSIPDRYTDRSCFTVTEWEGEFLGSQGKRAGTLYAGTDKIELWSPNFVTRFTYSIPIEQELREGTFDETLLFYERLEEEDLFQANPYTLYSGGDYSFTRITNHLNTDGPRIMLLRGSFACVFAPFLALGCSELTTIDLRYFQDDLPAYIDWVDPDMILLLYSPGAIATDALFSFDQPAGEDSAESAA